jgi:hypothetical protein
MEVFYIAIVVSSAAVVVILLVWVAMMMHSGNTQFNSEAGDCPNGYVVRPTSQQLYNGENAYACVVPMDHMSYYSNNNAGAFRYGKNGKSTAILGYNYDATAREATINFNNSMWLGKTGRCNKYKWATNNHIGKIIEWDGITNSQASAC